MGWLRRITEHPTTRVVLLILAGAQAMVGAFILGLAVNIGTSAVRQEGPPAGAVDRGPFPLHATPVSGVFGVPASVTVAADGSLWLTESNPPAMARIDGATGVVSRSPTRLPWGLGSVTPRRGGGVWFTDPAGSAIGFVTSSGALVRYPAGAKGFPRGVAEGPDGSAWFTFDGEGGDWVGRMTPTGNVTRFPLPPGRPDPASIVAGPDGNLWFTVGSSLGRITPNGVLTEVQLPAAVGPTALTAGPGEAVWFATNTSGGGARVGSVSTRPEPEVTALYDLPDGAVRGIAAGSDGNLWVTEQSRERIARVMPDGQVTEYTLEPGQYPEAIAAGKGQLWFTYNSPGGPGGVGRFDVPR